MPKDHTTSALSRPPIVNDDIADDAVVTHQLRCSYGGFEAVKGIDLSIAKGEFFALLGTNGAGKTTTMETLEGHRPASSGIVRVLGMDPHRQRRNLRPKLGIMLQESGFAGELTVQETVRMWLRLSSSEEARPENQAQTIRDALDSLQLTNRSDTTVQQLSGGQRRRLDLILATVNRPELLFLDEPTTGLDPESRERTWDVVQRLRTSGTTIVLTTHYLEEAEAMADRIAIMHAGRIAVTGTVAEILTAQPAQIRFQLPEPFTNPDQLDMALRLRQRETITINDQGTYTLSTDTLEETLFRLLAWSKAGGHQLLRLTATEASLAEVFRIVSALPTGAATVPEGAAA
ncbi:ABC transporter ATP-binding protein [Salinibacterium sp. ZJ454]|uniref:ABC transporter ATP-binding protein n=1 Tax=Salinibacterium sp. ZJ454 TaxID=2708339 RepID=UPI001FBC098E|nr:ABC transporter ATP-binding protein [Salinibacterium sp. ZJ454]